MKASAWYILVSYVIVVVVLGWPGVIACGLHIGSLILSGRWK